MRQQDKTKMSSKIFKDMLVHPKIPGKADNIKTDSLEADVIFVTPQDLFDSNLLDEYFWAITEDNLEAIQGIFSQVTKEEKDTLLNGKFRFHDDIYSRFYQVIEKHEKKFDQTVLKRLCVNKPVSLAVAYGAVNVFECLLSNGANIFTQEEEGVGIMHVMIATCSIDSDLEENILKIYHSLLDKFTESVDRKKLLLEEDDEGLCPLESAMNHRSYKLFKAILNTENAFVDVKSQTGKVVEYEYDLSIYNNGKRCETNPLYYMEDVCYDEMGKFVEAGILDIPVVKSWIDRKVARSKPIIIVWALFRCIYPIIFFIDEGKYSQVARESCFNGSYAGSVFSLFKEGVEKHNRSFLFHTITSILLAIPTLVTDLIEFILWLQKETNYCNRHKGKQRKSKYIVSCGVFRVCQFTQAILGMTIALVIAMPIESAYYYTVIFSTTFRCLMLFTLLFFVQNVPVIGFFIIGFKKMIVALLNFIFLFFTILLTFWSLFKSIAMYWCKPSCPFSPCKNNSNSFYNTFLVLLNMVPMEAEHCHSNGYVLMQAFHFIYVLILTILIINYLVAVMSSAYSDLSQYQTQVITLYRLHFANLIECRIRNMLKCLRISRFSRNKPPLLIKTTEVARAKNRQHKGKKHLGKLGFSSSKTCV